MFVVGVVEVTIPWDGRVEAARAEKRQTYSPLVEALSGNIFEKEKKWSLFMGINIHFKSDIQFFNVFFQQEQEHQYALFRLRLVHLINVYRKVVVWL